MGGQDQTRISDFGFIVGELPHGPLDKISDVPGVLVGHSTINDERSHTGVTVIVPREQVLLHKCVAACCVLNGFGKTTGLMQVDELGQLETPIALTNTLNVGLVSDALVQHELDEAAGLGVSVRTLNPVVGECNDGVLSDITLRAVRARNVEEALAGATADFPEGCVGGGTGMVCHGLKGGIGSASRVIDLGGRSFTLGILVQANHGRLDQLTVCGDRMGSEIATRIEALTPERDQGSCLMVVATDLPVSSRQLRRIIKRCGVGLARCGSYWGHGSGDVAIGFTTAHDLPDADEPATLGLEVMAERRLEPVFMACAEATEEAVLNALATAAPLRGYTGRLCHALREFL